MKDKKITKEELESHIKELESKGVIPKPYRIIGGEQFINECYKTLHEYAKNMTVEDWEKSAKEYERICKEIDDETTKRN